MDVHIQKNEIRSVSLLCKNINSGWNKYTSLLSGTVKLLEENTEGTLQGIGVGRDFQ